MKRKTDTIKINTRRVAYWLLICCGMTFVMALLGAITRLTESGLSITDWNPLMGALPPLNDAQWDKAFDGYKQIPQYQILNRGMTLAAFKHIYFWEWLHRLWGRLIGIVFALPLLFFVLRKRVRGRLALELVGLLALGGVQGFIGWFMVKSGLETRTFVSPYRLAMHLGCALLLYAFMLWLALSLLRGTKLQAAPKMTRAHKIQGWGVLAFLVLTMIWGALVAGLHAGEAYNTWPLMEGDVLPDAAFTLLPKWQNIFGNLALVQFIHRWLAPTTMVLILVWVMRGFKRTRRKRDRRWLLALALMAGTQVALGISTLLTHVDIATATAHQAGAITLLSLLLINLQRLGIVRRRQIKDPGLRSGSEVAPAGPEPQELAADALD